jgi:plasma-membrane proton-efflux P-type ATPase
VTEQQGLSSAEAAERLRKYGPNETPEPKPHALLSFLRKFWGLSAWMLELIAVLSFVLGKRADFWIALALLVVNAMLGFLQESRAAAAVASLRHHLSMLARVRRDDVWQTVPVRDLVPDDVVRLRAGDIVPADAQVIEGALEADQSALTGESAAVGRSPGETLYAGSVVRRGEATAAVTATGARTYFGRTIQLVSSAQPKLHVEAVVTRVVRWLFAIVGTLVALSTVAAVLEGQQLLELLPLSLVLLMSAVPVALPVMFTVSMAIGSMEMARRGALITRLNAAEDAASVDVLCADKTGTLTLNRLTVTGARAAPDFSEDAVLRIGAWASNEADQDPIDLAFMRAARDRGILSAPYRTVTFVPFSPHTRRTEAVVEIDGRQLRATKGALRAVAVAAGVTPDEVERLEANADLEAAQGVRVLAVAVADGDGPLRFAGTATLYDPPRPDSRRLIEELRSLGIAVKMLTGDALPVARAVARELGLGNVVRVAPADKTGQPGAPLSQITEADGLAEVFPENKFDVVKGLQAAGHVVAMTGDGVNDAPALRQAEVGIAVSGATDVAKSAASVVLTAEGLGGIIDLVRIGRAIYQRVLTWIINKISRTILKAGFVVFAFLATGKFAISALGMVLLVFMTDFMKIALSTDRVRPSPRPETWKIGPLVGVAVALGVLMLAESLGFLAYAWRAFDLADGRLSTFTFQTLLFFAVFSILSIRERRAFWASPPSAMLAAALALDIVAGWMVGIYGLSELRPLPLSVSAAIFGYTLVCSLVLNDLIKCAIFRRVERT